ncbi:MAG: sigma-70 family RNA polymerase sigma factor [Dehalococcoidales bacterium]|nr:sigma-70 family RNA polymerase sigma factor [Dehalococcoidales bacterium]
MLGEAVAGIRVEARTAVTFEDAFRMYQTPIYNYALRMLGDADNAYDATLTSFEKAYKAWPRLADDADVRAWLYRITTNTCLDELRRRKIIRWQPWEKFTSVFHPKQVAPDSPEREAVRGERATLVRSALQQLPPKYRAALVMRECQDLSCEEIGEALGISRGAAKLVLLRARRKLKDVYLSLGGEPLDQ